MNQFVRGVLATAMLFSLAAPAAGAPPAEFCDAHG